jgi:hypothetical protein
MELGRSQERVKQEALEVCNNGSNLIKWQEDKKQRTLRKAVLNRLKDKLNSEQPEEMSNLRRVIVGKSAANLLNNYKGGKMSKKYPLPDFLKGQITQEVYERWLRRKAQAHVIRDRRRFNNSIINGENYRIAIHDAVLKSNGNDFYTGEKLDWSLISKYDNDKSKKDKGDYKKIFALLPTVDHFDDGRDSINFKICGWRTNDAKNDMKLQDFLALCQAILEHNGYVVNNRP